MVSSPMMSGSTEKDEAQHRGPLGWTGGQYSAVRALLACAALLNLSAPDVTVTVASWTLATLLIVGLMDRWAAAGLAALCLFQDPGIRFEPTLWSLPLLEVALLAHLLNPPKPYGSVPALDRIDPGGGWRFNPWVHHGLWWAFSLGHAVCGATTLLPLISGSGGWFETMRWPELVACGQLLVLPLSLTNTTRRWAWVMSVGVTLLLLPRSPLILGSLTLSHMMLIVPRWFGAPSRSSDILFYDGDCGLCHRAVRFWLAEDPSGESMRFAPLDSVAFRDRLSEAERTSLPDSLVILTDKGTLLVRSKAVLFGLYALGGLWRPIAALLWLIPWFLRDGLYRVVARIRTTLFKQPEDACPLMPNHLRARFLLDPTENSPT